MNRSLQVLAQWAAERAERDEDPDDRRLWRQIAGEVDRYLDAQEADEHADGPDEPLWDPWS